MHYSTQAGGSIRSEFYTDLHFIVRQKIWNCLIFYKAENR